MTFRSKPAQQQRFRLVTDGKSMFELRRASSMMAYQPETLSSRSLISANRMPISQRPRALKTVPEADAGNPTSPGGVFRSSAIAWPLLAAIRRGLGVADRTAVGLPQPLASTDLETMREYADRSRRRR